MTIITSKCVENNILIVSSCDFCVTNVYRDNGQNKVLLVELVLYI